MLFNIIKFVLKFIVCKLIIEAIADYLYNTEYPFNPLTYITGMLVGIVVTMIIII